VLCKFHAPTGIIGNPITYMHDGRQYVAVLTAAGGWAGIGQAEGLTKGSEGPGAVGLTRTLSD
jgi:glucose dehydrogenase